MTEWPAAFALTVLIEAPVVVAMTRAHLGWRVALLAGVGLQLLTHPALWFLVPQFEPYLAWVAVAETAVTLTEAGALTLVLRRFGCDKAAVIGLGTSVIANGVSTSIGLALVQAAN